MADGSSDPRLDPLLLWSDPWLLALAKPSGLLSQPGLGPELADCLLSRSQLRWPGARLVHRLDRDTSGLILLARDAESHRRLSMAFAERRVRKTYLARVHGMPAARGGWIKQPLARIATQPPRYGVVPEARGGKPALSRWRRLDRLNPLDRPDGARWVSIAAPPCCCSPTPAAPTSCGCIWPGWATPFWGIRSTHTPAAQAVHR